jgi:hypothetical protein
MLWIRVDDHYDHIPILLKIENENENPSVPFKFNHVWLKEEGF